MSFFLYFIYTYRWGCKRNWFESTAKKDDLRIYNAYTSDLLHGRARGGDEKRSRGCPLFIRVHYNIHYCEKRNGFLFVRFVGILTRKFLLFAKKNYVYEKHTYVLTRMQKIASGVRNAVFKFQQICRIAFKRIHIVSKQKENLYRVDKIIYYTERVIIINNLRRHYNIVMR